MLNTLQVTKINDKRLTTKVSYEWLKDAVLNNFIYVESEDKTIKYSIPKIDLNKVNNIKNTLISNTPLDNVYTFKIGKDTYNEDKSILQLDKDSSVINNRFTITNGKHRLQAIFDIFTKEQRNIDGNVILNIDIV